MPLDYMIYLILFALNGAAAGVLVSTACSLFELRRQSRRLAETLGREGAR